MKTRKASPNFHHLFAIVASMAMSILFVYARIDLAYFIFLPFSVAAILIITKQIFINRIKRPENFVKTSFFKKNYYILEPD